jgi:putative DNA methylase
MRKKLIEVALPLEAINAESAREKSIRHGHPSTLHLWWARRPLAACRAVLWSSLVDDPSSWPDKFPTEEDQKRERERLFDILGRITIETDKKGNHKQVVRGLVSWDDIKNPAIIDEAQKEIARCLAWDRGEEPPTQPDAVRDYIAKYAPPAYDPFAGGGSIPLEAQRLGLEAHASDLNPVAVLINKALIEIPPKFKDLPPINPENRQKKGMNFWKGAQGLAADVRYYGQWMREEAFQRIGHLYPKVALPKEYGDDAEATVIAWLWARTVKCPNPACGCQMPLVKSFQLSTKKGKEAGIQPTVQQGKGENQPNVEMMAETAVPRIRFQVQLGTGEVPDETVGRKGAVCVACGSPVELDYVRSEGCGGRMGAQLMAIVAEGNKGRIYLSPTDEQEQIANSAQPKWKPESELVGKAAVNVPLYGLKTHADLFTSRQLVALAAFSDLVSEVKEKAIQDAVAAGLSDDDVPLNDGGTGAKAYSEAISTYLAFGVNRLADRNSAICSWDVGYTKVRNTFARQAIPMTWDFCEANPMSDSTGNFNGAIAWVIKTLEEYAGWNYAKVTHHNATATHKDDSNPKIISTDPPYYDNISYADLSDFFYVWMRCSLLSIYPDIFSTLLVPKTQELVAAPYRFGGSKKKAKVFFEERLGQAFKRMHDISHANYPITIYYAFKQAETDKKGETNELVSSTGWETMLEGLIQSGFSINGTWPMRSELSNRMIASGTNALASSIVLVCRPRPETAPKITRRQFLSELKKELPKALKTLQQGNIAPVDLAQASIGPGMAVYSQYAAVLENDGSPMRVRTALQLINQLLDEYLTEQEGEFDSDTRWALTWFEQHQFNEGQYGDAETLSKARNTSIQGLEQAGILTAKAGKVRLLKRSELPSDWNPEQDNRVPHWEITQHLIRALDKTGEIGAAELLAKLGDGGEIARDLAYRLYNLCDRKGWSAEGIGYNSLVISWPEISRLARESKKSEPIQGSLF